MDYFMDLKTLKEKEYKNQVIENDQNYDGLTGRQSVSNIARYWVNLNHSPKSQVERGFPSKEKRQRLLDKSLIPLAANDP